jgi:hypothetical protein
MDAPASAKGQDWLAHLQPAVGLGAMGFATINFDSTNMEWDKQ